MYNTKLSKFDNNIDGFDDDHLILFKYPFESNGFTFISHMATTLDHSSDKHIMIITDYPTLIKNKLDQYQSSTGLSGFETSFDDIIVTNETVNNLNKLSTEEDMIIFYHRENLFNYNDLNELKELQSENNISIWVCDEDFDDKLKINADFIFEYGFTINNSLKQNYIDIVKNDKNRYMGRVVIKFNPYVSIDKEETH